MTWDIFAFMLFASTLVFEETVANDKALVLAFLQPSDIVMDS